MVVVVVWILLLRVVVALWRRVNGILEARTCCRRKCGVIVIRAVFAPRQFAEEASFGRSGARVRHEV